MADITDTGARSISCSRVEMTELVMPPDANHRGTAFGGRVMQWIDLAGSMAAMRHSRMAVVTASIDQMAFLAPLHVGEIAVLRAHLNAVFGTSMEVEVNLMAEDPVAGERRHCCEAFLTFVALGPDGHPAKAPTLRCETEEERQRALEAGARRSDRLARRQKSAPA